MNHRIVSLIALTLFLSPVAFSVNTVSWPSLPDVNGSATLPAQEWEFQEGPRTIKVYIYYPGKSITNINADTGLMLSLHNWGGTNAIGTADPQILADTYNVIGICVDYLQSGKYDSKTSPPYDFGYLQSLDALLALYWTHSQLKSNNTSFNSGRIFCTGGSGGGNVTQMANKLAPRTFAAIIDMCGMAKLNNDIAFGLEGGSYLNAGYSKDSKAPNYLSPDAQEIRDLSNPVHLKQMKEWGCTTTIYIVHGSTDTICPIDEKRSVIRNMKATGFSVYPLILEDKHLDGKIYASTGHSLGNRTLIVQDVADAALNPSSNSRAIRRGPSDFERKETLSFKTSNGFWDIDYSNGYPIGKFRPIGLSQLSPSQTKVLILTD